MQLKWKVCSGCVGESEQSKNATYSFPNKDAWQTVHIAPLSALITYLSILFLKISPLSIVFNNFIINYNYSWFLSAKKWVRTYLLPISLYKTQNKKNAQKGVCQNIVAKNKRENVLKLK